MKRFAECKDVSLTRARENMKGDGRHSVLEKECGAKRNSHFTLYAKDITEMNKTEIGFSETWILFPV